MIPGMLDLRVYQGDRYELFLRVRDEEWDEINEVWIAGDYTDLTGYTVRSQIRDFSTDALGAEFTCTVKDQTSSPGSVLCVMTPSVTSQLQVGTSYRWDLELESPDGPDYIQTYIRGQVTVEKEVTRVEP